MAVPVIAERAWSLLAEREIEIQAALSQLKSSLRLCAEQRETLSSAISVTQTLAIQAQELMADPKRATRCSRRSRRRSSASRARPFIDSLGVVRCASARVLLGLDLAGRDFLQEALASPRVIISRFLIPRGTVATLIVSEAQRDANGDPKAVAAVSWTFNGSRALRAIRCAGGGHRSRARRSRHDHRRHPARPALIGTSYGDAAKLAKVERRTRGRSKLRPIRV